MRISKQGWKGGSIRTPAKRRWRDRMRRTEGGDLSCFEGMRLLAGIGSERAILDQAQ